MILAACFMLAGCKPDAPDTTTDKGLNGTWASEYDSYVITEEKITYDDGGYGYGWEGLVEEVTDDYIYVSIKDKYYAVSYKELTDKACKFSNAYKADGKTREDSLKAAKEEFTVENKYFEIYGEYARTK